MMTHQPNKHFNSYKERLDLEPLRVYCMGHGGRRVIKKHNNMEQKRVIGYKQIPYQQVIRDECAGDVVGLHARLYEECRDDQGDQGPYELQNLAN